MPRRTKANANNVATGRTGDQLKLKELGLRNVRSYDDVRFEFAPGVTVIIGNSNEGKSNIVRAILDIINNGTATAQYVRHGKDTGTADLIMNALADNGAFQSVQLVKGKKNSKRTNAYVVQSKSMKQPFEDVGKQVPEAVQDVLRMWPVTYDRNCVECLNVAGQRGAQFFVDNTAPQRAKILGTVSGLHIVTKAIKELRSDASAQTTVVRLRHSDSELATQRLQEFADRFDVAKFKRSTSDLAERRSQLQQVAELLGKVHEEIGNMDKAKRQADRLRAVVRYSEGLDAIAGRLAEVRGAAKGVQAVQELVSQAEQASASVERLSGGIQTLEAEIAAERKLADDIAKQIGNCPVCGSKLNADSRKKLAHFQQHPIS